MSDFVFWTITLVCLYKNYIELSWTFVQVCANDSSKEIHLHSQIIIKLL